jgi:hypothetical protein
LIKRLINTGMGGDESGEAVKNGQADGMKM